MALLKVTMTPWIAENEVVAAPPAPVQAHPKATQVGSERILASTRHYEAAEERLRAAERETKRHHRDGGRASFPHREPKHLLAPTSAPLQRFEAPVPKWNRRKKRFADS